MASERRPQSPRQMTRRDLVMLCEQQDDEIARLTRENGQPDTYLSAQLFERADKIEPQDGVSANLLRQAARRLNRESPKADWCPHHGEECLHDGGTCVDDPEPTVVGFTGNAPTMWRCPSCGTWNFRTVPCYRCRASAPGADPEPQP